MKTASAVAEATAPIVRLLDPHEDGPRGGNEVARARAFTAPLVIGRELPTGEDVLAHADGVAAILAAIGAAPPLCAAAYLVHAADELGEPDAVLTPLFGASQAALVAHARKLARCSARRKARGSSGAGRALQIERVRKMLLAFSRDLRVVLLRLASRLQTLRFFAASKTPCPPDLAAEAMQVFAPLANRLGIWQIKWELEDLAFRFLDPEQYRTIARLLDETRADREARVAAMRASLAADLAAHGLAVEVHGRPKHLYSIWKKMRRKHLGFAKVLDVIALRVIASDVAACYAVLGRVHERYRAIAGELDDYIARPKANGYRSLHTVVEGDDGGAVEIQIRTAEMHEHAEYGVSAHWAYKEADARQRRGQRRRLVRGEGRAGAAGRPAPAARLGARPRQRWPTRRAGRRRRAPLPSRRAVAFDDRIYVFTPQAAVVELAAGATPIDFAYAVHTDLGHRCRGAKVDGAIVPLNTRAAKRPDGRGERRQGRRAVARLAQSGARLPAERALEGEGALLVQRPGAGGDRRARPRGGREAPAARRADGAQARRARDAARLSQRRRAVRGRRQGRALAEEHRGAAAPGAAAEERCRRHRAQAVALAGGRRRRPRRRRRLAADGAGALLPAGAARRDRRLRHARQGRRRPPRRLHATCASWSRARPSASSTSPGAAPIPRRPVLYPVDVSVEASDRSGLLRDVSEVLAKEKINVTGVRSQSVRDGAGGTAFMTFTVEVADASQARRRARARVPHHGRALGAAPLSAGGWISARESASRGRRARR